MSRDPCQKLAGIILAAGGSSRLGRPKQTIEWQGKAMISRAVEAALQICGAGLIVVTGANAESVEACIKQYAVTVVRNSDWAEGASGSLRAGLQSLGQFQFSGFLLLLSDQPLVTASDLARLRHAWEAAPTQPVASHYNGLRGVPAIFPASFRTELMALTGDQGARSVLRSAAECTELAMPQASMDIDTTEDLEVLLATKSREDERADK